MKPFVTPEEMKALDRRTIEVRKISSFDLMRQVGAEIADDLDSEFSAREDFLFLCGPGDNGGDAYIAAEILRKRGRRVDVFSVLEPRSENCRRAFKSYQGPRSNKLKKTSVLVEGIFGLQSRSGLEPHVKKIVREANQRECIRVAIDLPCDEFQADLTLTVAFPKTTMLRPEVAARLGRVEFVGRDFATPRESKLWALSWQDAAPPQKPSRSHKASFGRCGIVGGSATMPGAPILAAEAAARCGAGYSTLYFAKPSKSFSLKIPDASFIFKQKWTPNDLAAESALVIGCGGKPKINFRSLTQPAVIDASALGEATAAEIDAWKKCKMPLILTPHPGEAAKILRTSKERILQNPQKAVQDLVLRTGQTVYLKSSPGYLKFSPKYSQGRDEVIVNLVFNSVFATAGSGDVLSGLVGGSLAMGDLDFRSSVFRGLLFQRAVGEVLRRRMHSISSDQLMVFSKASEIWRQRRSR